MANTKVFLIWSAMNCFWHCRRLYLTRDTLVFIAKWVTFLCKERSPKRLSANNEQRSISAISSDRIFVELWFGHLTSLCGLNFKQFRGLEDKFVYFFIVFMACTNYHITSYQGRYDGGVSIAFCKMMHQVGSTINEHKWASELIYRKKWKHCLVVTCNRTTLMMPKSLCKRLEMPESIVTSVTSTHQPIHVCLLLFLSLKLHRHRHMRLGKILLHWPVM